jgi:hypothetical protein
VVAFGPADLLALARPLPPQMASAVEDALAPFGLTLNDLPLRAEQLAGAVAKTSRVPFPLKLS